jgi:hypothetical protein
MLHPRRVPWGGNVIGRVKDGAEKRGYPDDQYILLGDGVLVVV